MISDKYKCIFVHIPKTAGTSIEKKLGHFKYLKRGVQDHRPISQIKPVTLKDISQAIISCDTILVKRHIKKIIKDLNSNFYKKYSNYYKFSFVRNPWSRVFSWYNNVMRDEKHIIRYNVKNNCTFKEFLQYHMDQKQLKTQLYWLRDNDGNVPIDYIGRFENLDTDFAHIAGIIGLKDYNLPKLLVSTTSHYTNYYDDEMIEIIFNRYVEEIEYFQFKYGE